MDIQRAIDVIGHFGHLQADDTKSVMNQIMRGEATDAQIGAYLMGLRMKGETRVEISGSAQAMIVNAHKVPTKYVGEQLLDTCGTGGDNSGTFNISTTVAFVAAGAEIPVAKHGIRAITSKCGSADVLGELGVNLDLTPEQVGQCVDEVGIGFLFAVKLHPAMKYVVGPRREIGTRTIFNILGPLTNPAGARNRLMGVFTADLTELLARVFGELGAKSAIVVNGYGGLDELTTTGPNTVSHFKDGDVHTYTLDPLDFGFEGASIQDLMGGELADNAAILRGVLSGELKDAKRDVVVLNSAAALVAADKADDIPAGIKLAEEVIDSGAALEKLDKLISFSQSMES